MGYQARISDGVMPPADFSFLPIVPFDNSTIAGTTEAYRGGVAAGASIFGAGTEIGENLLKLQDGASQLVAGLGQLSAGADPVVRWPGQHGRPGLSSARRRRRRRCPTASMS